MSDRSPGQHQEVDGLSAELYSELNRLAIAREEVFQSTVPECNFQESFKQTKQGRLPRSILADQ